MNNQSSLATSKQIERRPLNYATIDRRSQGYDNGQLGSARVKLGQLGIGENGFEYVPNISMLREKGARQKQEMRVHARKVMRIADFMAIFSQPCPPPSLPSWQSQAVLRRTSAVRIALLKHRKIITSATQCLSDNTSVMGMD